MIIPAVPTFLSNDTSLAKLQALSACVAFVSNPQSYPLWHFYRAATMSIGTASTWTQFPTPVLAFDTDGIFTSPGIATIQTQGYYATEGCVPFISQAGTFAVKASFLWTAGSSNAHYTLGTTVRYGLRGGQPAGGVSVDETVCLSDVCPYVCYPGDTIQIQAWASVTATTDYCNPSGATYGRLVPNFTGRFLRTGS